MHAIYAEATNDCLPYSRDILKPYGQLDPILSWCDRECAGKWLWRMNSSSSYNTPGQYTFYFETERDCVAFCLKWA